ncbi:MAG: amidase [Betaproteobacteria bacterium RIFCSPLOWO2_02_FULL_67_19]|nr:MAG: amidase [Betaproteobacteria bacterium RIFCSPLOWO2_02_FULL_67_19]
MPAIPDLTAVALAARFARGEGSPLEAARACLERIDACEPKLNAMYRIDREGALAAARAAEARWRAKTPLSPLDGVPVTLKENIYTRGDPAPIGTRANDDAPPQAADAPPAARLREAGCVILGKTTMPDFGMLSAGVSSIHGITRNPWRLDRNTSGSSAGAGAAAAAGYAPLHLGTDIGGSVRLPATHCGIFALKPSLGRVPVYPPYIGRVTGPMTRDVASAALMMNLLAKPDARDFMSLPYDGTDFTADLERIDLKKLRIGFLADMKVGLAVHPEVRAAAQAAAKALESTGAKVEAMASYLTPELADGMERFFEARSYNDFVQLPREKQAKVLPFIAEWCSWRAKGFSGRDVMAAYGAYVALREKTVAATLPYDFVISPTSPILPYEAELPSPNNDPHNALPHIAFTVPYNMSEQPAASLNWAFSAEGLPIGVQVIGRRFDDAGVLRLARALEQLRPAQRAWPEMN